MIASASRNLFSMTTILPRSICWTSPESSSPTLLELLADAGALPFAHALDDALLRRLDRGAAELIERHFFLEHVPRLELRILEPGLLERDLRAGVFDRLDDRLEHDDTDRPLHFVDPDFGAHVGAVPLHEGRMQTVLEQVDQLAALELLGSGQL